MKKIVFVLSGAILISGQIYAQEIKKEKDPNEQIIVNKKFDENGNLIQYDSTYVHQWSSDSTFQFSFPDNDFFARDGFPDLNSFFKGFMGDSAFGGLNFPDNFNFDPFNEDDFFNHFQFPDSMMLNGFTFQNDSLMYNYFSDSTGNVYPGLGFPDFEEFQKQLNEQFKKYPFSEFQSPQFNNNEQKEEWGKLIEKQQKEIEEFKKKWDEENDKK